MTVASTPRGGAWLIEETGEVFTRERLTDEQRHDRPDGRRVRRPGSDARASTSSSTRTGRWRGRSCSAPRELGLLATDVPEAYGGLDLDKVSSVIVGEAVGRCASFATTFGAQTGLAITPLLCFGTEEQKQKYLPRLVTGEIIGAYALSESGSGSDALGARAQSDAAAGRQLRPQRREDVDHQRRLRRRLHRLRQGRRRATSPPSSSNARFPASAPARKSTSSGCSGRRRRR